MTKEDKETAIQSVRDDPEAAVKRALSERNYLIISTLALAVQDASLWSRLRDAGIVTLFTEILVDEWRDPAMPEVSSCRVLLLLLGPTTYFDHH